jgi:hypothetical protein
MWRARRVFVPPRSEGRVGLLRRPLTATGAALGLGQSRAADGTPRKPDSLSAEERARRPSSARRSVGGARRLRRAQLRRQPSC